MTIPRVTVLSGFLGSGKTTLLRRILQNTEGLRIAVLVNDMGEVNIDANMIRRLGHTMPSSSSAPLVELTNGCICCTLREDMVRQLGSIVQSGDIDYIVIESTGIAEPMPVAAGFTFGVQGKSEEGEQLPLSDLAKLDTMVTVVDLAMFDEYLGSGEKAGDAFGKSKGEEEGAPEEERGLGELLCEQVEFATTIILNKADKVSAEAVERTKALVKTLNRDAAVLTATRCDVPIADVLGTGRFSFTSAMQHAGWAKELRNDGEHVPETIEYGISSFVYQRRRPFHPVRLHSLFTSRRLFSSLGVVRMKGFLWIPTHSDSYCQLSSAGPCWELEIEGAWYKSLPHHRLAEEMASIGMTEEEFAKGHPEWSNSRIGDRRQEIVIIARNMDKVSVEAALDSCLLTEEEWAKGDIWVKSLPDIFDLEEEYEEEVEESEEDEEEEEVVAAEKSSNKRTGPDSAPTAKKPRK